MKVDIIQLLSIFDELLPLTNEEEGTYWFKTTRNDELIITLAISIYESKIAISIYQNPKTPLTSLHFTNCLEINVLDEKRKFLEVFHENGRCFLSLLGNPILEYREGVSPQS